MPLFLQNLLSLLLASPRSAMDLLIMLVVSHLVFSYERFWKPCRQHNQSLRVPPSEAYSSNNCRSCTYLVVLLHRVPWTTGGRTRGLREGPTAKGHQGQKAQKNQQFLHPSQQGSSSD